MSVITLSRELGSRGDDVAMAVAEKLKLRLVGRDLINQAARQAGVPEVALAEIDELGLLGVKPSKEALRQYRQTAELVINELADAGDVLLVGRGSQIALRERPGVMHVRIIAPKASRIRCVQERYRISVEAATARVETSDAARTGYLQRQYGVRSNTPDLYDLTVNMAHLTVEDAVAIICLTAARVSGAANEVRP
jgi:cytidylate kinase